jgi:hypothetical protein
MIRVQGYIQDYDVVRLNGDLSMGIGKVTPPLTPQTAGSLFGFLAFCCTGLKSGLMAAHVFSTDWNWYCPLLPNFPPWTPHSTASTPSDPPLSILGRMPRMLRSASALAAFGSARWRLLLHADCLCHLRCDPC